jgi:hypothetical protein
VRAAVFQRNDVIESKLAHRQTVAAQVAGHTVSLNDSGTVNANALRCSATASLLQLTDLASPLRIGSQPSASGSAVLLAMARSIVTRLLPAGLDVLGVLTLIRLASARFTLMTPIAVITRKLGYLGLLDLADTASTALAILALIPDEQERHGVALAVPSPVMKFAPAARVKGPNTSRDRTFLHDILLPTSSSSRHGFPSGMAV